jgi:hypothetical protein
MTEERNYMEEIADAVTKMAEGYQSPSDGLPDQPPAKPGAGYDDPLWADRTKGIRRIEVKGSKFKTHLVDRKKSGEPKINVNHKGVEEYVVVHKGFVLAPHQRVWCWFEGVPINTGDQLAYEICDPPKGMEGVLIARRDDKVFWRKKDVEHQLP